MLVHVNKQVEGLVILADIILKPEVDIHASFLSFAVTNPTQLHQRLSSMGSSFETSGCHHHQQQQQLVSGRGSSPRLLSTH